MSQSLFPSLPFSLCYKNKNKYSYKRKSIIPFEPPGNLACRVRCPQTQEISSHEGTSLPGLWPMSPSASFSQDLGPCLLIPRRGRLASRQWVCQPAPLCRGRSVLGGRSRWPWAAARCSPVCGLDSATCACLGASSTLESTEKLRRLQKLEAHASKARSACCVHLRHGVSTLGKCSQ